MKSVFLLMLIPLLVGFSSDTYDSLDLNGAKELLNKLQIEYSILTAQSNDIKNNMDIINNETIKDSLNLKSTSDSAIALSKKIKEEKINIESLNKKIKEGKYITKKIKKNGKSTYQKIKTELDKSEKKKIEEKIFKSTEAIALYQEQVIDLNLNYDLIKNKIEKERIQISILSEQLEPIEAAMLDYLSDIDYLKSKVSSLSNANSITTGGAIDYTVVRNEIVEYAFTFLGTPYEWGGNGPQTFDCSGFTKYVFGHFGINIKRTSKEQATQGIPVELEDLRPGDLVFFGTPVHHVGIYIGSNFYINSPKSGDVVKVADIRKRNDFNCGRRFAEYDGTAMDWANQNVSNASIQTGGSSNFSTSEK